MRRMDRAEVTRIDPARRAALSVNPWAASEMRRAASTVTALNQNHHPFRLRYPDDDDRRRQPCARSSLVPLFFVYTLVLRSTRV